MLPIFSVVVVLVRVESVVVAVATVEDGRRIAAKLDLAVPRLRSKSWRLQALVKLKNASTSVV